MNIMVSIQTTAFNHAPYIAQTLESFLMQKTTFPFEIVIHDDASTDETAEIIRQYAQKYPDIIRPIFQTENQYSKGIDIYRTFLDPVSRGKYLAICEGDDCWTDVYKLQKQVDFMETHPDYSACVHNTMLLNVNTGQQTLMYSVKNDYDVPFSKIFKNGAAAYQTSSLLFRKELESALLVDCPPYFVVPDFADWCFSDYCYAIYLRSCGKIRFLNEVMSLYRRYTIGSWTCSHRNDSPSQGCLRHIRVLKSFDEYTKGIYHNEVVCAITRQYFHTLLTYIKRFLRFTFKRFTHKSI